MSFPHVLGAAFFTLVLVAGCGGGGGGGTEPTAFSLSPSPTASFTSDSSTVRPGEAVGIEVSQPAGQDPASTQDPVTGEVDGSPVDVVVPGGGEAVVVVPDLPAGTHTLTLHVRGKTVTLNFDVTDLPLTGDARENLAALIAEALRLLDEHLASHLQDTAAAGLRAQLAAAQALLASLTDAQVQALYQQLMANGMPAADAPGACVAASAQQEARMNAMLRTARLTAWLAAKHAAHPTHGTQVAVLLAQARMDESLRRLVTYTHAVMTRCNGNADLAQRLEQVRGAHDRSAKAAAAALR